MAKQNSATYCYKQKDKDKYIEQHTEDTNVWSSLQLEGIPNGENVTPENTHKNCAIYKEASKAKAHNQRQDQCILNKVIAVVMCEHVRNDRTCYCVEENIELDCQVHIELIQINVLLILPP